MTSTAQPVKIRKPLGDRILSVVCYIIAIVFAICCLIPFIMRCRPPSPARSAWPATLCPLSHRVLSQAYKLLFRTSQIFQSYGVSLFVTIFGTFLSLVTSVLLAYPLSTGQLKYGSQINFFVYFTMLFSGGLVPSYMLISRYLHMKDSIWVLIIPILINPGICSCFATSLPASRLQWPSPPRIDGANDFTIMWKIILPCATPALATIGLFYALAYWNNWFQALMYIDKSALKPLQAIIMEMLRNTEFLKQMAGQIGISSLDLPTTTSKMATAMVTIGPIVLVYPFVQKYFTSGIMVGSVKADAAPKICIESPHCRAADRKCFIIKRRNPMKNTLKRAASLALTGAMAVSLAACGGSASSTGSTSTAASTGGSTSAPAETTLKIYMFGQAEGFDAIQQKFEEETKDTLNIKLDIVWSDVKTHREKIPLMMANQEEADLVFDAYWMNLSTMHNQVLMPA